jgi:GTP1/Obg family GTP-binding protein
MTLIGMKINHYFPLHYHPSLFLLFKYAPQATTSSTTAVEASQVEGEIIFEPEALFHIQKAHPPQQIIVNLNEIVTHFSRLAHLSYFLNMLFVTLFEPRDVGHALSDLSWVNDMHEELEKFKRNQV